MYKPEQQLNTYESMTVLELKDICKERGLTGYSNLNKVELIKLLGE